MNLKQYFNGKSSVGGATLILVITLLLSNILGMIRDRFLAQKIPTTLLDTYYAAFRLPDLVFNILILGAISAAFIPVFTSYISQKKEKEAWHITNSLINIALVSLIVINIALFFLLPYLIPIIVPKFDPTKQELTLKLARMFLISPLFFGISYIFGGVLNSYKRFLAYSLAPLVYNLSIILATIFLTKPFGIFGIAYGVIAGAFLHMFIQFITSVNLGFRYKLVIDFSHTAVRKIGKLMLPRAIGLGANQIMLVVYTAIASTLTAGSVAIFNLADNIQTMPTVVFGTSFATAVFPTLSEKLSLGKKEDFSIYIWRSARAILYLLIPISVVIIALRTQIVRLILGSGYFGWDQTVNTADTLAFFCISLFAQGLIPLLAKSFYALQNTKTPTIISIISIVISITLGFFLVRRLGIEGLALAFSIGSIINFLILYLVIRAQIPEIKNKEKEGIKFLIRVIFATIVMTVVIQLSKKHITGPFIDLSTGWEVLTQFMVAAILGGCTYILVTWYLGCEEFEQVKNVLLRRFRPEAK